jgi:hypothetical protein
MIRFRSPPHLITHQRRRQRQAGEGEQGHAAIGNASLNRNEVDSG